MNGDEHDDDDDVADDDEDGDADQNDDVGSCADAKNVIVRKGCMQGWLHQAKAVSQCQLHQAMV